MALPKVEPEGWAVALLVVLAAFSAGVQLPLVLQALGGQDYFAEDVPLKLATLALLGVSLYLLRPALTWESARQPPKAAPPPPAPAARPPPSNPAPPTATLPVSPPAMPYFLTLETPLSRGPVWPPGEPLPITVQLRGGPPGVDDVDVELEVRRGGGPGARTLLAMRGDVAVLSQTIPGPGPFSVTARALRQGQVVATASVEGVASSYREEIGRRFESLKAQAQQAGLNVGPEATPRELRDAIARRTPQLRRALEDVVSSVEAALYAQEEVGREQYERLVRALQEIGRRGLEAAPHA